MNRPKGFRLFRSGVPLQVRIYDNKGATLDRYTVVFLSPDRWQHYAQMGVKPCGAFGTLNHDVHRWPIDETKPDGTRNGTPPAVGRSHAWLGRRIRFNDLPAECQEVVLKDYKALWA